MDGDMRNTEDLKAEVEDKDEDTWFVKLLNKKTGEPKTWVYVDKSEFPSKQSAITYLTKRYETQSRKKKSTKAKTKRKSKGGKK